MIKVVYSEPKKLACPQEIIVSFHYKQKIVDAIRTIPERFWDAKNKEWHLSYDSLPYLQTCLNDEVFDITGQPIDKKEFGKKVIVNQYEQPKELVTKLYDFQLRGYNEMMNYNKYLLLWQMGCGKSIVSIATALKRKEIDKIQHCLIICGVNGLKYNWQDEIKLHANMDCIILGNRQNKKGVWSVKSNSAKLEDLDKLTEYFIVTNVETLRDKEILDRLKTLIKNGTIELIIADEVHKCKAVSAQQTKGLLALAKYAKYFYGLTGTILSNSPLDAYVPLKCVDGERANFTAFKSHYCTFGGYGGYEIVGYKHLDELQLKLGAVSSRKTKDEVLDLPPKIYKVDYVELGAKQRKIYKEVLQSIMNDIDNIILSPNPLSQLIRLRQATADTSILSSSINESAKFERLDEIIEELGDEKIVIFSNWTTVTNKLKERYKQYNPAIITGEVQDREGEKQKFIKDKSCRVFIGTIGAAGTGITLTVANTVVFVDDPFTFAAYEQAADRIYRIGQQKSCTIISLIAKNTIDERVHKIMLRKKNVSDAIVDKKYDLKDKNTIMWLLEG